MTTRALRGPIHCKTEDDLRVARVAGYIDAEILYQGQRLAAAPVAPEPIRTPVITLPPVRIEPAAVRADIDIATLASREFDADAEIRAEFSGDRASYIAYRKAETAGKFRFVGQ
jgi:hypothetical protein